MGCVGSKKASKNKLTNDQLKRIELQTSFSEAEILNWHKVFVVSIFCLLTCNCSYRIF